MIWTLLIVSLGLASAQVVREYVSPEYLDSLRASGQYEEYARLLGVDVSLVQPDEQRSEGSEFNFVSHLGDIVLGEEQERTAINFNRYPSMKWPNGRIPIEISDEFNDDERRTIINACADFNQRNDQVKIVWRNGHNDYVQVINGNGCWARLGRAGGQQALSVQKNGCLNRGTIQHEFMHAFGFHHEHNRVDRDNNIEVLWNNIKEEWKSQYEKVNPRDYNTFGSYDYDSVMHYPIWSPDNPGKDAFKLPSGIDRNRIGQRDGCSPGDVEKMRQAYS